MAVKIQVEVFWAVMPSSAVVGKQRFGAPCCLHLQGTAEVCKVLQNVGTIPQHFTVSQPRR